MRIDRRKSRLPKFLLLLALMGIYQSVSAMDQRPPTPTERVAQCLTNAWDAYEECIGDTPWYAEGLCVLKNVADDALCPKYCRHDSGSIVSRRIGTELAPPFCLVCCAVACSVPAPVEVAVDIQPDRRLEVSLLRDDAPVDLGAVLALDNHRVLVVDRTTSDLWLIADSASALSARVILPGWRRGRQRILAAALRGPHLQVRDRAGQLFVLDTTTWMERSSGRMTLPAHAVVLDAVGEAERFNLLLRVRQPMSQGSVRHEVWEIRGSDLRRLWSSEPLASDVLARQNDLPALLIDGGTVMVTGSVPPRIIRVFPDTGTILLENVPRRPVSAVVRDTYRRARAAYPAAARVAEPRLNPPLLRARPLGAAILVVAVTGGPDGESEGIDLYCGTRFVRALANHSSIQRVLLLPRGVLILRSLSATVLALDYAMYSSLDLGCSA
jgi:hypothetical protein